MRIETKFGLGLPSDGRYLWYIVPENENGCDCEVDGCEETVPMHIGDFLYERDEFKVWCKDHADRAEPGAVVFRIEKADPMDAEEGYVRGWQCAILGPDVGAEVESNLASFFQTSGMTVREAKS